MIVNHIGYIVESIDNFSESLFQYEAVSKKYDPIQKANLALFKYENICIELIEPTSPESFTWNFLKGGGATYHHLCYEVSSVEEALGFIKQLKMIKVFGPVPAVLFDNRSVLFAFSKNKEVVEFLVS